MSAVERVRLNSLLIFPSRITPAGPSVDDHAIAYCTVRQTHCLWVTPSTYRTDSGSPLIITLLILPLMMTPVDPSVVDHVTADRSVRQTHCLWVTPSAYRTDRRSPLMITLLILLLMFTPVDLDFFVTMSNYMTSPMPSTMILVCCFIYNYFYTMNPPVP